ncbi:MAG: hypothetical protein ABS75_17640 [Pelagibacterium sp. SCN 63-23]|nr:MAG: hypothetical protein ABS75_17640 [Pelagibacterium sp. SCN 63-23]
MRYELISMEQIPLGGAAVSFVVKRAAIAGLVMERGLDGLLVERGFDGPTSIIDALTFAMGRGSGPEATFVLPPCDQYWPENFPDLIDLRQPDKEQDSGSC